ncbi:uncharacterized protein A1O9_06041 [Exophiala aquamarina CBS 119918]|uniref:Uncharacterized protein n=1 Tax=Exophiala aquamarina CBS 119918 TaxID=1182545 RepID=A0A072PFR4_9EURO|nr:uncharacterized protein A1O9_06041 [Exophiala aquamarina CBS 119918]KEF58118.1 hypothetical protein A1O9_06041 [Exophiala aquamarina CBS 119918]
MFTGPREPSLTLPQLTIKEYEQDSVYHIDITSVASGLSTTQENRTLDWNERDHADRIFGNVKGRSRWWKTGEFEKLTPGGEEVAGFLRAETLKDGKTASKFLDDEHVQSWAKNVDSGGGWTAEQNWGFEEIEEKRYYTRRVVVEKEGSVQMARLVYNYTGKVEKKEEEDDQDLAYGEES